MERAVPQEPAAGEAFATYVLPEIDMLYRVALTISRRAAEAEDLVQDTLLRAYRGIERFDGRHPRAWLLTIMRNAEVSRHRRQRAQLLDRGDEADAVPDLGQGPEDVVMGELFDAAVARALEGLPSRMRRVVSLVDVAGLAYEEAAQAIGIPVGTVMSRLHRGRARIRKRLEAERFRGRETE